MVDVDAVEALLAGRYRLGELLGRGGMAEVYDAIDLRLRRRVAVKALRPEMTERADMRARFEREARAAARLHHPHVVTVFDTGDDEGVAFIVMERLPGETLADRMAGGPVDQEWLRRVAGDVVAALGAAHTAGLVHRDVKPGNILLAADGSAKVADFGIAKTVEPVEGDTGVFDGTATNLLLGTPAYLAPERIDGHPATPRSDLWSLGVMLYEALAGVKPFVGPTPLAVAYAVQQLDPEPLAARRPDVDPRLATVVARAMTPDPDARYQSAAEVARDLEPPGDVMGTSRHTGGPTLVMSAGGGAPLLGTAGAENGLGPPEAEVPTAGLATARSPAREGPGTPGEHPARAHGPDRPGVAASPRRGRALRRALVVALAMLALGALALAWQSRTTPQAEQNPADERAALARQMRELAGELGRADGARGPEVARRLRTVADQVEAGRGATSAADLLDDVGRWRAIGQLRDEAAERVSALLAKVPGVRDVDTTTTSAPRAPTTRVTRPPSRQASTPPSSTTTTSTPTTTTPTTADPGPGGGTTNPEVGPGSVPAPGPASDGSGSTEPGPGGTGPSGAQGQGFGRVPGSDPWSGGGDGNGDDRGD